MGWLPSLKETSTWRVMGERKLEAAWMLKLAISVFRSPCCAVSTRTRATCPHGAV